MADIKPFHITKKYEHKKFVQFQEAQIKKKSSYSSLIITSDKKLILCERSSSFYFSHMTSIFKKLLHQERVLKNDMVCLILSYILHFKLYELTTFLVWFDSFYNIFTDITLDEYQALKKEVDKTSLQFLDNKSLLFIGNPTFILSLKEIAFSFTRYKFRGEDNQFACMSDESIYVLPGGREASIDNNTKDTLFREIREEIGYDMYSNDIKIVSNDFGFVEKDEDLTPILVCITTDKIFNRYFVEYISIILIPDTSEDISNSFTPSKEVSSILLLDVSNEIDLMFTNKTVTPLLHAFKKV